MIALHSSFDIYDDRGFLPEKDPISILPSAWNQIESAGKELPKLLMTSVLRNELSKLPILKIETLSVQEIEYAMIIYSYLGHAYVWGYDTPTDTLPKSIALPWYLLAQKLGRPPILSYASYALHNWKRIYPDQPIELGNIALIQNFLGGADEEWFIIVHVDIEAKSWGAISSLLLAQEAAEKKDSNTLLALLKSVSTSIEDMFKTLCRMREFCGPYIYYHRVRPYIHGWKGNPALPNGVHYEGVDAYNNQPQFFRGETGAQSTIIPSIDAALGIAQPDDPLSKHLQEMRIYMPPKHVHFLETVEKKSAVIRDFVRLQIKNRPDLRDIYNSCVEGVQKFRSKHLEYASHYIDQQQQTKAGNTNKVGTGGTPFMVYLQKHRDATSSHLL